MAADKKALDRSNAAAEAVWRLFDDACSRIAAEGWRVHAAPARSTQWEDWGEAQYRPYLGPASARRCKACRSFAFNFEVPLRFGAGAYFKQPSQALTAAIEGYGSGWETGAYGDDLWLWRYQDARALLAQPDLNHQAELLKDFAVETFTILHSDPPNPRRANVAPDPSRS